MSFRHAQHLYHVVRSNDQTERFIRYSMIGGTTFMVDLALIALLTEVVGIFYAVSVAVAFVVASSLHYLGCRRWVFAGTKRGVIAGYMHFLGVLGIGIVIAVGVTAFLVEVFGMYYLLARVIVAVFVGFGSYLLNLFVTFRMAGRELKRSAQGKLQANKEA